MWRSNLLIAGKPDSEATGGEPRALFATHTLHARIRELERQRADAARRAELLGAVQRAILRIASADTADETIAHLLRAACDALGFTRAIYFGVDRDDGITARAQIEGSGSVEPSSEIPNLTSGSPLLRVLRGGTPLPMAGCESDMPVKNVRGTYVLSPLVHRMRTLGVLYADGRHDLTRTGEELALVHTLTSIAAVSLGNGTLLAHATELATVDPLTGLLNRRAIAERLATELELCRQNARPLTYVMIDVDDLKAINDSRGHAAGDETLKAVAAVLRRNSRAQDVVGRCGGDEFVLMLAGVDRELARALVARLCDDLREQRLSCSIGRALPKRISRVRLIVRSMRPRRQARTDFRSHKSPC